MDSSYGLNGINLIGLASGQYTSSDLIRYFFVSSYQPSYKPVISVGTAQPINELNSKLLADFNKSIDLITTEDTYYNEIQLNQTSFSTAYQLYLPLDNNFLIKYMKNGFDVFGVYPNGEYKELYWWNESPLVGYPNIWINLTNKIPEAIFVIYGLGINVNYPYAFNGSSVFYLFYNKDNYKQISYSHSSEFYGEYYNPSYEEGYINLTKVSYIPPYIYNSTMSKVYSQFACVNIKPSLNIYLVNATYSPYAERFSINSLYGNYNPLFPNLTIISYNGPYTSWGEIDG